MLTGLLLAGGKSSRFGSNKAFAEFLGELLVVRQTQLLLSICERVFISCHDTNQKNEYQKVLSAKGVDQHKIRFIVDLNQDGFQGPLSPFANSMILAHTKLLLVIPIDSPLITVDMINTMTKFCIMDADLVIWKDNEGIPTYTFFLAKIGWLKSIISSLKPNGSMSQIFHISRTVVELSMTDDGPLANANTPQHLKMLENKKTKSWKLKSISIIHRF